MTYEMLSALPMLVCLFWTLSLLFDARHNDRTKRVLCLFMGLSAVLYFTHSIYFNRSWPLLPLADSLYALSKLSIYPVYLIYIKLLSESRKLNFGDYRTLLPALLSFATCVAIWLMMDGGQREEYLHRVVYGREDAAAVSPLSLAQHLRFKATNIVNALQVIHVLWVGSRKITRYNREINDYYSNTEGKTFTRTRTLLIVFTITSLASFVMNIIGRHYFANPAYMILIPSLMFGTLFYALGYIGNRQNFTATDFAREMARSDSLEAKNKDWQGRSLTKAAQELILTKELFRQPDIKISDIAKLLNTNRTYISAALNSDLKISFSALINSYRIEYAKKLIAKSTDAGSKLTNADIIEMSGFANESSFYRTFKLFTGTTPRKWLGEQLHLVKREQG